MPILCKEAVGIEEDIVSELRLLTSPLVNEHPFRNQYIYSILKEIQNGSLKPSYQRSWSSFRAE